MIKTVARITSVERRTSKAGKPFGVVNADNGKEYTSWTDPLTNQAEGLEGQVVQLGFDETTKGQYTNRTLRFIQETGYSGLDLPTESGGASHDVSVENNELGVHGHDQPRRASVDAPLPGGDDDWLAVVRTVARRGEWRAANELQRREDISRSVALNNTVQFFQYLTEENRNPENVKVIFDFMLKALNGD